MGSLELPANIPNCAAREYKKVVEIKTSKMANFIEIYQFIDSWLARKGSDAQLFVP